MLPDKQYSRTEVFLNSIATGSNTDLPIPQSRSEQMLKAIIDGDTTDLPNPQSRMEIYTSNTSREYAIRL